MKCIKEKTRLALGGGPGQWNSNKRTYGGVAFASMYIVTDFLDVYNGIVK